MAPSRVLVWLTVLGCAAPLEPPAQRGALELVVEPDLAGLSGAAPRLSVVGDAASLPLPQELSLWEGELTDSQLARVRRGERPATLVEREVPALGWLEVPSGAVVVRPSRYLAAETAHTVVSTRAGRLGVFHVAGEWEEPRLVRRWPPPNEPGAGLVVVCGPSLPASAWAFALEPALVTAELDPSFGSLDDTPCVAVRFDPVGDEPFVLPPAIDGHALDPEPLLPAAGAPPAHGVCDGLALASLCARVEDDRLNAVNPGDAALVRVVESAGARLFVVPAGGRWSLLGLEPDTEQHVQGEVFTRDGEVFAFDVRFRTAPARPRWVLNEVLANPLGAEPAGEWVELVNASSIPASLGGLWLEDGGGRSELPAHEVGPGEHVLLARSDFVGDERDAPVPPAVRLIRVPELGKNGLSNSGEPLRLLDASAARLSSFPALASRRAGVSLARRRLDSPDDEREAFGEHAAPGASPGAPNQLASTE